MTIKMARLAAGTAVAGVLALGAWMTSEGSGWVNPADARALANPASSASLMPTSTDSPAELDVPAWGESFSVVPVSLSADRALIPPDPLDTVGWWDAGAAPGSGQGAVTLVVHRDSVEQGPGPFAALEDLPAGSSITLDGVAYQVLDITEYGRYDLPAEMIFDQGGPEKLVIVTCGGDFDPGSGWDSNVVATFAPA